MHAAQLSPTLWILDIYIFQTCMQTQGNGMRLAGLGHRSNQEAKKNPGCSWVQKVNERMKTFTPGPV
ncbi:hypothetical protein WN944_009697 [Citrus x changshan-huyou]|uniref:Uncharacterized protein n=1 Tax=Citrus x changshan-huyou TaxID=2935761 RepID=A0AAP0MSN1_9ROSI